MLGLETEKSKESKSWRQKTSIMCKKNKKLRMLGLDAQRQEGM